MAAPLGTVFLAWLVAGWFWWPLVCGGGLVGGDVYSYSLPQKVVLADSLAEGWLPLWNPYVGWGYPILGESQTGAAYPLHLLCYGLFDVGTAWNVVLLTHYGLAFVAAAWAARWLGLSTPAALWTALIYVYGWFPVRAFLDWAILGGVYLPVTVGCTRAFLVTGRTRYLVGLSLAIALQLLGGHFQLAFYTWLLLAGLWLWRGDCGFDSSGDTTINVRPTYRSALLWGLLAGSLGVGLAAVQLLPTWELKGRSQRAAVGGEHAPAYGHIPPQYLTQLVAPWWWYAEPAALDETLGRLRVGTVSAGTNRVEAHLYCGLLPIVAALGTIAVGAWNRRLRGGIAVWGLILLVSLIYVTGWPVVFLQGLPGFGFFRGPGRAGIVATWAIGLLAGTGLDQWRQRLRSPWRSLVTNGVWLVTLYDLAYVPEGISYAVAVGRPPIHERARSELRLFLAAEPGPVRLYAPGANTPSMLGVSAWPVYLGLGPREYFESASPFPGGPAEDFHAYSPERVAWLRATGVTHILSFEPLAARGWPVTLAWQGFDRLLNPAWARFQEPLYLYRLDHAPGRVTWEDGTTEGLTVRHLTPNQVEVLVDSAAGGRVILKELAYLGWQVLLDGQPAQPLVIEDRFRGVEVPPGRHGVLWWYRPGSVYWGAVVSLLSAGGVGLLAWRRGIAPSVAALSPRPENRSVGPVSR
jgi:hypothetical protein